MLIKDDAKTIADAKKEAYVKGKSLEYVPECFNKIREAANNIEYETRIQIENVRFIPEIVGELKTILQASGYATRISYGRRDSQIIHIYWRELREEEKKDRI